MNGSKSWLSVLIVLGVAISLGNRRLGAIRRENWFCSFRIVCAAFRGARAGLFQSARFDHRAGALAQRRGDSYPGFHRRHSSGRRRSGRGGIQRGAIRNYQWRLSRRCILPTSRIIWWFAKRRSTRAGSRSVADLRGKACAINAKGVATEWVLDEVLKPGGLRIDNVDVKTLPFPEMLPALDNGAIDCGIITEPFATQAEEKNIGVRPLKAKPGAKPVPITVAFWNSDWAKKNDSAARAFMSGYLRAVRDLSEPNAWKAPVHTEIINKHTGVAAAVLLKTRAPVFSPNLELEDKEMMSQQEFNLRLGYLKYKEMKPIKELVDLSYAEAAVKQAGRK